MKAVCVLLCLALARLAAGHIFRRQHHPQNMELIVQPLNYIDQYQQQQLTPEVIEAASTLQSQFRPRPPVYEPQVPTQYESQSQRSQETQDTRYQPMQKKKVKQQTSDSTSKESNSQETVRISQYTEKKKVKPQTSDSKSKESNSQETVRISQYAENKKVKQQTSDSSSKESNSQENVRISQYAEKKKVKQQTSDSTSNESNSQETVRFSQYAAPMYADTLPMTKGKSHRKEMKPAHGDVIAWNGIRIASSPINPVTQMEIEKIFNDAYTTMTHVTKKNKKIYHQTYLAAAESVEEDATLNATQLLQKYKYPVEEHKIKTDDGYLLTLFHIPAKDQTLDRQRPVVFLMHGLLGSADDWLLMGPGKSLAYLLADAGYDVWLGNARGSKYSRRHVSKHSALADFWQYGIDEIALNDLPSMIDYALKTSNQKKMYYVAHSLGTTAFFALAATRPEYNEKINMMYALSPMVYMSNVRSPMLRMIAPNSPFSERLHHQLGHGQFKPSVELVHFLGGQMLENEIGCKNVSSNVYFVMSGVNVENMDAEKVPVIMRHLPAGASARLIKQYGQAVASQEFTKYDFGAKLNEKVYGSRQPPKYEIKQVKAPVSLYYSEEDWLAHPTDVQRLEAELPNVKDSFKILEPHFAHMDFQYGKNAPEMVYKRLIESMNNRESQRNYIY